MSQRALNQLYLYRYVVFMVIGIVAIVVMLCLALLTITWRYSQNLEPLYSEEIAGHEGRKQQKDYEKSESVQSNQEPGRNSMGLEVLNHNPAYEAASREELSRSRRLQNLFIQTRHEYEIVLILTIMMPVILIALGVLFYRRVLCPLRSLGRGMELLARKEYREVDAQRMEPFVRPVFDKYNRMVRRMQDLEKAHVNRETSLSDALEEKTRAIVQQQAMLGRVDRLAALGDVSARMAHRLRNPLTGVLMTLTNLCEENPSPYVRNRLKLSIEALMRSFNELTALLEESKEEPESAITLTLADVIDELFLLIRHQSNRSDLMLSNEIDQEFKCTLPETATRHALMKLLENAVETQSKRGSCRVKVNAKRGYGYIEIDVVDAGQGIDADEDLECRPWNRTVQETVQRAGLSIVQRFCERMNGSLRLNNLPHGGSSACLILPQENTHV
jgi:signal transduction histidine kinase